jgi:predicted butyrate kinase (DUF1464 family)
MSGSDFFFGFQSTEAIANKEIYGQEIVRGCIIRSGLHLVLCKSLMQLFQNVEETSVVEHVKYYIVSLNTVCKSRKLKKIKDWTDNFSFIILCAHIVA